jgi:acetate---CoA ligase (ADP-forming)
MADARPLAALLDSRTLAVVGASSRPGSPGDRVVHHLTASGYDGEIVLISRNEERIGGRLAYPSLAAYPGSIDHALLLVPASALEVTIRECVELKVGAASIFAAGFAESGAEGERRQAELCELAAAGCVRLLGPNCLGVMNAHTGLMATASSALESITIRPGPVSIVSQSGAIGMHFVALLEEAGLGLRYYVSTGNEVDVTAGEVLDHLASDPATDVVLIYLEGVRDPGRFCSALLRLRDAGKTVVGIKVGRTRRSSAAIASHTAALAGNDAVYDAVLKRLGVVRVDSLSRAVDVATLVVSGASRRRRPSRVGVVSISGGMGALMAETLEASGYDLPSPKPSAQTAMQEIMPFCTPQNPIDMTGQITAEPDKFADFMALVINDGQWDTLAILLSYTVLVPRVFDVFCSVLLAQAAESDVLLAVDGLFDNAQRALLTAHGIVAGRDSQDLIRRLDLLRAVHDAGVPRGSFRPTSPGLPADTTLPDIIAMTRMAQSGVPMARWLVVRTAAEAQAAAEKLGASVAFKLLVPGILHKAQAGLVVTGVGPGDAAIVAARLLADRPPGAELIAQAMASPDWAEIILGAHRDEVFGLVFLVGIGGLGAETRADTAVLLPPVMQADFGSALRSLHAPVRTRSGQAIDGDALWHAFESLAELASTDRAITDAELNPVLVGPPGDGAVAVDAVIRCRAGIPDGLDVDQQRGTPEAG